MTLLAMPRAIHRPGRPPRAPPSSVPAPPPTDAAPEEGPREAGPDGTYPRILAAPRSLRERFEDAGPLWFITATCALVGTVLHVTSPKVGAGPLEVWLLFYALGAVAAVGAGVSMAVEENEEDGAGRKRSREATRRAPSRAGRMSPEDGGSAPGDPGKADEPSPARPRGFPAATNLTGRAGPLARVHAPAPVLSVAPPVEPEGLETAPGTASEVLIELNRLEEDLNRTRRSRPRARLVPPV